MALNTLHDLYLEELRDLYSAEHQLLKALPKMAKAASHSELQDAFKDHLKTTHGQVARLETIFTTPGLSGGPDRDNPRSGCRGRPTR